MHGIQYIVISYAYTRRRTQRPGSLQSWASALVRPGNIKAFLVISVLYAFLYQVIVGGSLEEFGFGTFRLQDQYNRFIPELAIGASSLRGAYDMFALAAIEVASLTHFYFDSFIWKVSDPKTQEGL